MGGLWVDYEKDNDTGGVVVGSPRNQQTNVPHLYAIGEADYQYHGGNRLGANSLLSCIFSGLLVGPGVDNLLSNMGGPAAADMPASLFDDAVKREQQHWDRLVAADGTENPYEMHRELGESMTKNVTVVRQNSDIQETLDKISELDERYRRVGVTDRGDWTNQTVAFTRALGDMLCLARVITQGALLRDECRGAHFKPDVDIPSPTADDPAGLKREAEAWCDAFAEKNNKWLKTTITRHTPDGPQFDYEEVDTSLIPPRPRTYGMKGAEIIEETWRDRLAQARERGAHDTVATA
jgi:succinate dehydrogenase / fumarate reductase flavoprotein subunit